MITSVVCGSFGPIDELRLEQTPSASLGPQEIRIRVRAAGINFADLLMTAGKYQTRPALPFIPGIEAAGVVVEIGEEVAGSKIGDRVMFHRWDGCFSEEVVLDQHDAIEVPAIFSFPEAASFMVATSTATNALLQRGQLAAGEVLLVHGAAGGVGLAAVEVGKLLGATVIATASTPEKVELAASRGADYGINHAQENFRERVLEITNGAGADVILDPIGGSVFDDSVRCIAWGGRLLVVGFASGRVPEIRANHPLLRCFSIVGVRAFEHVKRKPADGEAYRAWMLGHVNAGKLKPYVSAVYPLERFREAMALLESRKAVGRVVLEMK